MKTWNNAEIEVLDVKNTAYGTMNPEVPDGEKVAVVDSDGNLLGYKQGWGEEAQSNAN